MPVAPDPVTLARVLLRLPQADALEVSGALRQETRVLLDEDTAGLAAAAGAASQGIDLGSLSVCR
jgi:hypothetical protein